MNNYDFLILSPIEFEHLTRDLLQKKLEVMFESFKAGKDNGIDLRCVNYNHKKIIIQAKRYENFKNLISNLKKEVSKVVILKPDRYIISTTVGLSPSDKDKILDLFQPYIISTEDILGKDDLNNLLNIYEEIELKYYKLWLTSSNTLKAILQNKINNQSEFELNEIKKQVSLYVQNDSFNKGIHILREHRYVIISGIPGIGKTTLARVLSMQLLSDGPAEFVYLNDSIAEGYEKFDKSKKQIFFFDDFLGKNFFEKKSRTNYDHTLVKFIKEINKSSNKFLILTTREYILNQAKLSFEAFKLYNIEIAKCILDLESFTNIIRAQILYNHLFFANLPINYLKNLISPSSHLKIVKHPNYNPRIIETLINEKIWQKCEANEFANTIKSYFDNPESVWLFAFENSLDKLSQYTLLVLLTMGTPVKIENLEEALISFLKINKSKYNIDFDSIEYKRSLRALENTFIKTQKDSYNTVVVNYQNPSIQDFLISYLRDKKNLIVSILESAIFREQFFTIFTSVVAQKKNILEKIHLSEDLQNLVLSVIKQKFLELKNCRVNKNYEFGGDFSWKINTSTNYQFLNSMLNELSHNKIEAHNFVSQEFKNIIYIKEQSYPEQNAYVKLLFGLNLTSFSFDEEELINSFLNATCHLENFELFKKLEQKFPLTYKKVSSKDSFSVKICDLVKIEIEEVEGPNMQDLYAAITVVAKEFNLDLYEFLSNLDDQIIDYENTIESDSYFEERLREVDENIIDDDKVIEEIFKSFAEN